MGVSRTQRPRYGPLSTAPASHQPSQLRRRAGASADVLEGRSGRSRRYALRTNRSFMSAPRCPPRSRDCSLRLQPTWLSTSRPGHRPPTGGASTQSAHSTRLRTRKNRRPQLHHGATRDAVAPVPSPYPAARIAVDADSWRAFRQAAIVRGIPVSVYLGGPAGGVPVSGRNRAGVAPPVVDARRRSPPRCCGCRCCPVGGAGARSRRRSWVS
jgi:hypothetical protein